MSGSDLNAWLRRNRLLAVAAGALLVLGALWLGGRVAGDSDPEVIEVTRLVSVTMPAEPVQEVTRIVVVTATPPATSPAVSPDPPTLQEAAVSGPITLDPAQATDAASAAVVRNVLETLVYPDPRNVGEFLPLLALRWQIEEGGQRYVFTIRRGVSFSNGTVLSVSDVAYSLQRLLLQSTTGGPQGLLLAPLLGYESGDVTEEVADGAFAGNQAALRENATERELSAICERVQEAVRADPVAGTVTITLEQPWAPLLMLLSQPWAGIISQEWAAARGDWDGSCENWAAWYAPALGETALATAILGSGPYVLDHWTPGREYVLTANNNYWRNNLNPMWDGGPAGSPALQAVRVLEVAEDHLRWNLLRDRQVATAPLSLSQAILADQLVGEVCARPGDGCVSGPAPDGPLRRIEELLPPDFLALVFNFNIASAANPYLGSGELDGNGVPATFFADANVRRAFAFCLDEAAYIDMALAGEGAATGSVLPAGWAAAEYPYPYDAQRCAEELQQALGGELAATGFRLQIPFLAGDAGQRAAAALLQERLQALNPDYQIEIVGLPPAAYTQAFEERQLPLAFIRWQPPLVDPHYYVVPLLADEIQDYQRLPDRLQETLTAFVSGGLAATTAEARREQYQQFELLWHEDLPFLPLPQPAQTRYEQRWLRGWFYQPEAAAPYYYAYSQQGAEE
ncbi:MAG: ABC transporter substrate-binding protein [Anaerolineae bacterium]|nr:ABC transporter substrate-binding protein [Anaerolineae bacterium]